MLRNFTNWTIGRQLYVLATIVLTGFLVVAGQDLLTRSAQERAFSKHMSELSDLREAVALDFLLLKTRYIEKEFIIRPDDKYVREQNELRDKILAAMDRAAIIFAEGTETETIASVRVGIDGYFKLWDEFVEQNLRMGFTDADGLRKKLDDESTAFATHLTSIIQHRPAAEDESVEAAYSNTRQMLNLMLLRRNVESRAAALGAVEELTARLDNTTSLSAAEKLDLHQALNVYATDLKAVVTLQALITEQADRFKVFYAPAKTGVDAIIASTAANQARLEEDYTQARRAGAIYMTVATVLSLLVVTSLAVLTARTLSHRIRHLARVMMSVANGDLSNDIPFADDKNEISAMARALIVFKNNGRRLADAATERERLEQESTQARQTAMIELAGTLDLGIKNIIANLAVTATQINDDSKSLTGVVQDTQDMTMTASAAARQASENVGSVAAAAEELTQSISEVVRQVGDTVAASERARLAAHASSTRIDGLTSSVARIGEVITLISEIAGQTNLLALNATIEAARAGEAGKGFAVVAGEVKTLANQTTRATDEISQQVRAIQFETASAVDEIQRISTVVLEVDAIARSMADAMRQQDEATRDIAHNISHVSQGASEISSQLEQLAASANNAGTASTRVQETSDDLFGLSRKLSSAVSGVIAELRGQP